MTFGQPFWLWALAVLPVFLALFFRSERKRAAIVRRIVAGRLVPHLAGSVSPARRRIRFGILLLGVAAVVLSLAQPRRGYTWEERKFKGRDVVLAIDVSRSMLANDLAPSRLARAKLAAEDLIGQLPGDRVGLIAFAGTSFLQAPLTADHGAVVAALHELDSNIIPRGGTDIAEAIRAAADAFGKGESDNRALVLFTDGEELEEDAVEAAKALKGAARIFTVGIGSAEGTIIALPGEDGQAEYVKDLNGEIVKSRLDEPRLREIAQSTDGFYVHLVSGPPEMQQIVREGLQPMTEHDLDSQYSRRPIERYQWPLSAGTVLLAASQLIGERRKKARLRTVAASALAYLVLGAGGDACAKNDGVQAYEQQDYKGALDSFDKQLGRRPDSDVLHFDLGSAAYKTGDLDRALKGFSTATTSSDPNLREKAEYNLGNALFQHGVARKDKKAEIQELNDAVQHYDSALKVQPKDADATYNRGIVQKLLAELQKEEQPQEQKKDEDQPKKDPKKDQGDKNQKDQDKNRSEGQKDKQDQQQKDQQQGGESKDQQEKSDAGQGQKPQDQQGGQKDQQSAGNAGAPKQEPQNDQKQDGQQPKEKESPAQPDDGKQAQQAKQQDGKEGGDSQNPEKGEQPRKLSGELKDAGKPSEANAGQPTPEQEAAAEAQAAADGRMTEQQARSLLESLKGEDERVHLLNPKGRKSPPGTYRDW